MAEISAIAVAESVDRVWDEFLKAYFNGAPHHVCGVDAVFPAARMSYGAGELAKPIDGLCITMVQENNFGSKGRQWLKGNGGKQVQDEAAWWIHLRAKVGPTGTTDGLGNSRYLARKAFDLFCALLRDPNTAQDLAGKGLFDFELGQGRPEEGVDYATWLVRVRGRLTYEW